MRVKVFGGNLARAAILTLSFSARRDDGPVDFRRAVAGQRQVVLSDKPGFGVEPNRDYWFQSSFSLRLATLLSIGGGSSIIQL